MNKLGKIVAVAATFAVVAGLIVAVIYTNGQGSARSPYEQCITRYVEQLTDRATARIWCYKKSPQARAAAEARD